MGDNNKNSISTELEDFVEDTPDFEEKIEITEIPVQKELYKIPKRFGSIPVDELPLGCDPEKQYYKIYPRVSLPFQRVERISFGHPELEPNRLFFGDNLHVMRMLPSNSIDLIYLDPPFFSGRHYNVIFGDSNEVRSFSDIWEGGMPGYLTWLNARLLEMKRLLKPTGSIYVHCDWHASHYIKVEMDKIFGYDNLLNEIVWGYSHGGRSGKTFGKKHDIIFWYRKGKKWLFNSKDPRIRIKMKSGSMSFGGKLRTDEDGRQYRLVYGTKTKEGKTKYYKYYLDEGKVPEDYWTDINSIQSQSPERIGYPTQKPEKLLERIIAATTDEGDIVADFFCGGGTTPVVAQKLNRRWIASDISRIAVAVTSDRISKIYTGAEGQETLKPVRDFTIEYWGMYEIPTLTRLTDEEFRQFVITAFNGRVAAADDFVHGYKMRVPLYVGSVSQEKPITKEEVISFSKNILEKKDLRHGIMLGWAFTPGAQDAARKIEEEGKATMEFVKISLIPIESQEFRREIVEKHREYTDLLTFILPPEIMLNIERVGPRRYEFDISESVSLNGGEIMNVQWDFDHKGGRFKSTQGYSFIRTKDNKPMLTVSYEFPRSSKKKIACKVQDDKGGENTKTVDLEVK